MGDSAGEATGTRAIPAMEVMENLLKCGICYENMNTALITPCSHNFCSLCIRKYMQYKTSCPQCFASVTELELKNNRVLDEMISVLQRLKTEMKSSSGVEEKTQIRTPQKPVPSEPVVSNPVMERLNSSLGSTPGTPEAKARPRSIFESLTRSPVAGSSKVVPKVPCPVCNVQIPERSINLHIDKCLESGGKPQQTNSIFNSQAQKSTNFPTRKRLPKLVYDLMKDAELRRKCADASLSTQGDKKTLIKRHRRYTLLYNSECDSANPRPVKDIVKQVEREEREESMANSKTWKSFQVDRKADPKVIEQAQAKYRSENESHFSKLLAELKQRQGNKKESKKSGSTPEKAAKVPTPSPEEASNPQLQEAEPVEQQQDSLANGEPSTPNSEMDDLLTQLHSPELRKKQKVNPYLEEDDSDSLFSEPLQRLAGPVNVISDDDDLWDDAPRRKVTKRPRGSQDELPVRRSRRKKLKS